MVPPESSQTERRVDIVLSAQPRDGKKRPPDASRRNNYWKNTGVSSAQAETLQQRTQDAICRQVKV